ncbi:MAG TPA: HAD-IIIC family phosphatase [Thermoanaerobaculia bacterium]
MSERPGPLPEVIVRSRFTHTISLDQHRSVCFHAVERTRLVVRSDVVAVLDALVHPKPSLAFIRDHSRSTGLPEEAVAGGIAELLQQSLLFGGTLEEEEAKYERLAAGLLGNDPEQMREWEAKWSAPTMDRYASVRVARDLSSFAPLTHHASVVLLGFCDVHFGADLLRDEARGRGIDLEVSALFEMQLEAAADQKPDFIIVGALAARHGHWYRSDGEGDLSADRYLRAARTLIDRLRAFTAAPILISNLPVPTLTPRGFADAHADSPVRRAKTINDGLLDLAAASRDVHVVDVDAALSRVGKRATLDDQLVPTSHLGGLGWWSMLPEHELRTIHGVPFEERVSDVFGIADSLLYDRTIAAEQVDWLQVLLGAGRRKCVIVDLDNTLWPGVLADTGAPFPPDLDHTLFSFHSIYAGIHQALKALASRGILLACVSKNDETVVKELWRYPRGAPMELLLTPEDFVTWRVNWKDKSENIRSIAEELNIGLDSLVFVDDHPVERDKVRQFLPEVLVLGDSMLTLRAKLLSMPELQVVSITEEAKGRTEMTRAQLERERMREAVADPEEYRRSLRLRCLIEKVGADDDLERVHELIVRTNQFNTTAWRVPRHELQTMLRDEVATLHVLRVEDRFTNYGLVGACLLRGAVVELFVMSCRVIGLGVEHALLRAAIRDSGAPVVQGRIIATDRNLPARNLFREHGFEEEGELWHLETARSPALAMLEDVQVHD